MPSSLIQSVKGSLWLRIAFVAILMLTMSGWTCTAIVGFQTCLGTTPTPQIALLSPPAISATANSVLLTVSGSAFVSQSQILWNGNALPTKFIDSRHLQITVTQQTFAQFGGSFGNDVLISVNTPVAGLGCPIPGSSTTLALAID